jgi:hypothetical protein
MGRDSHAVIATFDVGKFIPYLKAEGLFCQCFRYSFFAGRKSVTRIVLKKKAEWKRKGSLVKKI